MTYTNNPPYIYKHLLGRGVDNYMTPLCCLAYPLPLKCWGPLPPYPPSYMT